MSENIPEHSKEHFNNIADDYKDEISSHVRDHLINKWWGIVSEYVPPNSTMLDIGCGDGTNLDFLRSKEIDAKGVDASKGLIEKGQKLYPDLSPYLSVADALKLPYEDNTFDNTNMIGVLHHIYSRDHQIQAIKEALRITKPGGYLIIRESNLRNPLFRLFWNYIFPMTAKIDRFGGEHWISANYLKKMFPAELDSATYFTFIPSFLPESLLNKLYPLEAKLEKSFLRSMSAHYVAILHKQAK